LPGRKPLDLLSFYDFPEIEKKGISSIDIP
jgi:hypothetical protein